MEGQAAVRGVVGARYISAVMITLIPHWFRSRCGAYLGPDPQPPALVLCSGRSPGELQCGLRSSEHRAWVYEYFCVCSPLSWPQAELGFGSWVLSVLEKSHGIQVVTESSRWMCKPPGGTPDPGAKAGVTLPSAWLCQDQSTSWASSLLDTELQKLRS